MSANKPTMLHQHSWEWLRCPWSRLHIDYAGPVEGKMLLNVVDAYSKWLDVAIVNSATSTATIESLRRMFVTRGIPESIVSDNATVFASEEFTEFVTMNGIHHIRSASHHPATNGLAEHTVQTLKKSLKKTAPGSLQTRVSHFLFTYHSSHYYWHFPC